MGWGRFSSGSNGSSSAKGKSSTWSLGHSPFPFVGIYNPAIIPPSLDDLLACRRGRPLTFICPHRSKPSLFSDLLLTKEYCQCSANYLAYYTKHKDIPFIESTYAQRVSILGDTLKGKFTLYVKSFLIDLGIIFLTSISTLLLATCFYNLAYALSYAPFIGPLLDQEWVYKLAPSASLLLTLPFTIALGVGFMLECKKHYRVDWTRINQSVKITKDNSSEKEAP